MVALRSMTHHEHRPQKVDTRSAERYNASSRPAGSCSSPRRTRSNCLKDEKNARAPTPLMEKKNEENTRMTDKNMALDPKLDPEASQRSERKKPVHDEARPSYRQRKNKGKTTKTKSTKGKSKRHEVDRSWEEYSPPATQDSLEDEYPMIIQCWQ